MLWSGFIRGTREPRTDRAQPWRNAARSAGAPFTTRAANLPARLAGDGRHRPDNASRRFPRGGAALCPYAECPGSPSGWRGCHGVSPSPTAPSCLFATYPTESSTGRGFAAPPRRAATIRAHRSSQWRASPEFLAKRVRELLQKEAQRDLAAAVAHYAGTVGRPAGRIALRDTRSRWGSCTARG